MIRTYFGPDLGYKAVRMIKDAGILTMHQKKIVGARSAGYRLCDALMVSPHCDFVLTKRTSSGAEISSLINRLTSLKSWGWSELHEVYAKCLTRFHIDTVEAREVLAGHPGVEIGGPAWVGQSMGVYEQNENFLGDYKSVRLSVGRTGRLYHPISTLKGCIRSRILYRTPEGDDVRVRAFDIKASQPTFLAALMMYASGLESWPSMFTNKDSVLRAKKFGISTDVSVDIDPEEAARLKGIVEERDMYDFLRCRCESLTGWKPSRPNTKVSFLRDVAAKKGNYSPREIEKTFLTEFPSISNAIKQINTGDHSRLIRLLQWLESEVVINYMWKRLVWETKCAAFTVHDCFYIHPKCIEKLLEIQADAVSVLGIDLNLVEPKDGRQEAIDRKKEIYDLKESLSGGEV